MMEDQKKQRSIKKILPVSTRNKNNKQNMKTRFELNPESKRLIKEEETDTFNIYGEEERIGEKKELPHEFFN